MLVALGTATHISGGTEPAALLHRITVALDGSTAFLAIGLALVVLLISGRPRPVATAPSTDLSAVAA